MHVEPAESGNSPLHPKTNSEIEGGDPPISLPDFRRCQVGSLRPHERIALEDVLVVTKLSKVQYDMKRFNLPFDKLRSLYEEGGEDAERIFESHNRQQAAYSELEGLLSPSQIIGRDAISPSLAAKAGLVIAFGGDNHFQHVSHFLRDTPILGVNSDPLTSHGALLSDSITTLETTLKKLTSGEYTLEPWTRLQLEVGGVRLPPAVADIFIGEEKRVLMSRHTVQKFRADEYGEFKAETDPVEQKCSGVIVATGAGSSGWYLTAAGPVASSPMPFSPCEERARFAATEVSKTRQHDKALLFGEIKPDELLVFTSLNRNRGIASIDSLISQSFPRGTVAKLQLAKEPLLVART